MLHVLVGSSCNNNCIFCMEADREKRRIHILSQSQEDIRAMISSFPTPHGILFTSGEPTLSPELPGYVRLARECGFRDIALITNGRAFAYREVAERLAREGLNRVTVSIHGHTAKLHDGMTRAPGSFEQTRAGLQNLLALKATFQLQINTSSVITTRNLPHLRELFDLLSTAQVEVIVFNIMMAKGRGAQQLDRLMPQYGAVAAAVNELCAELSIEARKRLRVEDVPGCIARLLPEEVQGRLEEFHQFELRGSSGVAEVGLPKPDVDAADASVAPPDALVAAGTLKVRGDMIPQTASLRLNAGLGRDATHSLSGEAEVGEALVQLGRAMSVSDLSAKNDYYLTDRAFKERFQRVRGEPCRDCQDDRCAGVWEPYAQRFGWQEFSPMQVASTIRSGTDPSYRGR